MGMGLYFNGEPEEADRWFAECADLSPLSEMWIVGASSLAYRSLVAGEQGRLDEQGALAERAVELTQEHGLEEINGEAPAALGTSLAARGELEEARPLLEQGVMALRSYGQPLDLAHALICEARVLRALGERDAEAAAIAEARATVDSCPDPGILEEWVSALERSPRKRSRQENGELSERELAVLRALTGPLSERDIARELYLSHNTVHSHTRSIYRKLGVSSRSEAIQQARELGLLS
jgi:LuxR family maltose regulon positive regulatory protein